MCVFLSTSQEIGWKKRLRNNVFTVNVNVHKVGRRNAAGDAGLSAAAETCSLMMSVQE